jgi:hypothetical protein
MAEDQPEAVTEELANINGVKVTQPTKRRLRVYSFVTEKNANDIIEEALVAFLDAHKVIVSVDGEVQE